MINLHRQRRILQVAVTLALFLLGSPPHVLGEDYGGEVYQTPPSQGELVLRTFEHIAEEGTLRGTYVQVTPVTSDVPMPRLENGVYRCNTNHYCLCASMVYYHLTNGVKMFMSMGLLIRELPFHAFLNVEQLDGKPYLVKAEFLPEYPVERVQGQDRSSVLRDLFVFSAPFYSGSFWIWEADFIVGLLARYVLTELLGYNVRFWTLQDPLERDFLDQMSYLFGADYTGRPVFSPDFLGSVLGTTIDLSAKGSRRFAELFWALRQAFLTADPSEGQRLFRALVIKTLKDLTPAHLQDTAEARKDFAMVLLKNELKVTAGKRWNTVLDTLTSSGVVPSGSISRLDLGEVTPETDEDATITIGPTGGATVDPAVIAPVGSEQGNPTTTPVVAPATDVSSEPSKNDGSGCGRIEAPSRDSTGFWVLGAGLGLAWSLRRRRLRRA
ncbi:MAG: hypothetical protein A2284_18940 [Deltaproteobacteria bacterium RIFOXYA12_FULL_61_11]|nr:MAG: hypothetical protein A2284_18940 [Deltaproteobacteria bacterium RIFOXYA12_FULL_61_11]